MIDVERMTEEFRNGFSIAKIAEARGLKPNVAKELMLDGTPELKRRKIHPYQKHVVGMIEYKRVCAENERLKEANRILELRIEQMKSMRC